MTTLAIAPIRHSIVVRATPVRAFKVFTAGMGRWWPRRHSTLNAPVADVVVEPRVGGRWYERGEDGREAMFGEVLAWEPPGRLMLAWRLDGQWRHDPALIMEVEIRFIAEGASTRVELEHRDLERLGAEEGERMRVGAGGANGWPLVFAAFEAACARDGAP
jgi:uncharacterized protein YndB with AHSA1/START domain